MTNMEAVPACELCGDPIKSPAEARVHLRGYQHIECPEIDEGWMDLDEFEEECERLDTEEAKSMTDWLSYTGVN